MRTEYKMEPDELQEILNISKDREPVMKFGNYWTGNGPQERANAFWKLLAAKYGFVWDSAQPITGKGNEFFTAESKEEGHE